MSKEHKKMYKAGRQWVIGTLFATGLVLGVSQATSIAQADDGTAAPAQEQPTNNPQGDNPQSAPTNSHILSAKTAETPNQPATPSATPAQQQPAIYNDPKNTNQPAHDSTKNLDIW